MTTPGYAGHQLDYPPGSYFKLHTDVEGTGPRGYGDYIQYKTVQNHPETSSSPPIRKLPFKFAHPIAHSPFKRNELNHRRNRRTNSERIVYGVHGPKASHAQNAKNASSTNFSRVQRCRFGRGISRRIPSILIATDLSFRVELFRRSRSTLSLSHLCVRL